MLRISLCSTALTTLITFVMIILQHPDHRDSSILFLGNPRGLKIRPTFGNELRHHCLLYCHGPNATSFIPGNSVPFLNAWNCLFQMKSCAATKILSPQEQIYLLRGSWWALTKSWYRIWLIFKELVQIFANHQKGGLLHFLKQTVSTNILLPDHLKETQHLQLDPGPRRGKEDAFEKQIAGRWHVISLQEASECVDHDILRGRFHVTHCAGCAILFNKDTIYPNIDVKSIYLHDTRRDLPDQVVEGEQGWVMQGVLSRASFRRSPVSGQKTFTVLSLHISNIYAKKKGITKKLILSLRVKTTPQKPVFAMWNMQEFGIQIEWTMTGHNRTTTPRRKELCTWYCVCVVKCNWRKNILARRWGVRHQWQRKPRSRETSKRSTTWTRECARSCYSLRIPCSVLSHSSRTHRMAQDVWVFVSST